MLRKKMLALDDLLANPFDEKAVKDLYIRNTYTDLKTPYAARPMTS